MFWTVEKVKARIAELKSFRYRDRRKVHAFDFMEEENTEVIPSAPPSSINQGKMQTGEKWKGRDKYIWLEKKITIPEEWEGKTALGLFDFGKTGGGHNSGFESLLYVNGSPFQGVDANHQEVFFSRDRIGKTVLLQFRLWSGLEGIKGNHEIQEHQIKKAELAWLDQQTDDLYFTANAAIETVQLLAENQPERVNLLKALNQSFQLIDWTKPGSDEFYLSIYQADEYLNKKIDHIHQSHPLTVRGIGHTHIDVAWLWRLKHTREKSGRSFSTVLRLMEQYPEYTFLQTQPQLYDYIKTDYPEIYEQIKERIKEGRWEAGGAMWLEADCNIPSGESLTRQLLYGQHFLEKELGISPCNYLWLPDVFGYSWALPQILKKSGIHTFMTTKISWNQYNRLPHDTFIWKGIDGSEILTHFITTPDGSPKFTYNGEIKAASIQGIWDNYNDQEINDELLISYGYGDGGGGVNRDMLENIRRLDKMPGLPNVTTGRADTYFQNLHQRIEETEEYVHKWDGELYLEYHRGTYTSQAYNKKMNRHMELLYREAEWADTLHYVFNAAWSREHSALFSQGWKIILRNQFHDIIPGSSIQEVYTDSKKEYEEADQIGSNIRHTSLERIMSNENDAAYTVFNSSSWDVNGLVFIPAGRAAQWVDEKGKVLKSQLRHDGVLVQVENVPTLGYTTIFESQELPHKEGAIPFEISSDSLFTPYYQIKWDEKGHFTKIYDREHARDILSPNEKGNVFQVFEDKPLHYDAWDIDIFYKEKMQIISDLTGVEVIEQGALRAVIRFHWNYNTSTIQQDIIVYADNRRIEFQTDVDWHEQNQLLKVAFPVDIRSTEATYDIQYGNVKRPTHWNTSWDYARFETVAHQWVDLSERDYGVSLLNDSKYGHDIKENTMKLTLLKSAVMPDPSQDQGHHTFCYALYPHDKDWYESGTVKEAWSLNNPLFIKKGKINNGMLSFSLFETEADHIMIDAVKQAEEGNEVIVRLHEYSGKRGNIEMKSGAEVKEWVETDLMEKETGEKQRKPDIEFSIFPYEIKTFKIKIE
ncbi:alpha-mannosidase [Salibacterium aidingense]|uniref:alpha-mannosidase n=1 Tax=Salibacterium aidingense TaxID=384933 RepID=UPI00040332A9|nr:alpha-mannosidase [Salibacterium aidingense]